MGGMVHFASKEVPVIGLNEDEPAQSGQGIVLAVPVPNVSRGQNPAPLDEESEDAFTPVEAYAMFDRLAAIESRLLAAEEPLETQKDVIREGFEYLRSGLQRLGRRQWITLLTGVVVNLATTMALSVPEFQKLLSEF